MMRSQFVHGLVLALACAPAAATAANPPKAAETATPAPPPADVKPVEIADPEHYWQAGGFIKLTTPVRISVARGTDTLVYLKLPPTGTITTHYLADQKRMTFVFPAGTASDRVTIAQGGDGKGFVSDVRGTRWGDDGTEYFRVLRPTSLAANAPLTGFEWPRKDAKAQAGATAELIKMMRAIGGKVKELAASGRDLERFASLNECQSCHVANKPAGKNPDDPLPPWPTDGSGLYVPPAVLDDAAALSTADYFDDPNVGDKFVVAKCNSGKGANVLHEDGAGFYGCADQSMPVGHYDFTGAMKANEAHARDVCASRKYLFDRMDEAGRKAFAPAIAVCHPASG